MPDRPAPLRWSAFLVLALTAISVYTPVFAGNNLSSWRIADVGRQAQDCIRFPSGACYRFLFNLPAPCEVAPGDVFEMVAIVEHVFGTPSASPLLRATAKPSPIVVPIMPTSEEVNGGGCNPNWCSFGLVAGSDTVTRTMRFIADPSTPVGQVLVVDVSDGGNEPWLHMTDLELSGDVFHTTLERTTVTVTTATAAVSTTSMVNVWDSPFVVSITLLALTTVIGIGASTLLLRRPRSF